MANTPQYASTPVIGAATVNVADTNLFTPTTFGTVVTAGANGTRIDYVTITSIYASTAGLVNLFIYDGANYDLWYQIPIVAVTASTTAPGFIVSMSSNSMANIMPLTLPSGYSLRASVTTNQVAINPSIAGVAASQAVSTGAFATLVSTGSGVAASTTAIATAATVSSAYFTLTSTPYVMTNPCQVSLTSTGNQSAITFTITGLDPTGTEVSETLAGPNNTTVYSARVYSVVTGVYSGATMTGTTSVGYSAFYSFFPPNKIKQFSGSTSNAGVTWTIIGIDNDGTLITESLTGAAAASNVTSVNTFRSINTIKATGAATAASFGTAVALGGVQVVAYGGNF